MNEFHLFSKNTNVLTFNLTFMIIENNLGQCDKNLTKAEFVVRLIVVFFVRLIVGCQISRRPRYKHCWHPAHLEGCQTQSHLFIDSHTSIFVLCSRACVRTVFSCTKNLTKLKFATKNVTNANLLVLFIGTRHIYK